MRNQTGRLTERKALALPLPAKGYVIHWCPWTPGFGVRVTAAGARAWIAERRVDGKTTRRTLGRVDGRNAISSDAARRLMVDVSSELQQGRDRMAERRLERAAAKQAATQEALTFEVALRDYVKKKRRAKDGLPLKERTRTDYLAMVAPGRMVAISGRPMNDLSDTFTEDGPKPASQPARRTHDGELFAIASKSIHSITGDDLRDIYRNASERGERRAIYAMQVVRAVLNWHGVKVPDNPLSKDTAGKDRIVLGKTGGKPQPIPPEKLAAWWAASAQVPSREAADRYRVQLLTGMRPNEPEKIEVRDVDMEGGRITLRDTKNRSDHVVLMSKQVAAIIAPYVEGKRPGQRVFTVSDPRKTLTAINSIAGTSATAQNLRATFASVAEELVSAYSLKRMVNHADAGDVTGSHYIGKSEAQLRAAWQAVADAITGAT